jgi:hypothetical protein
MSCQTADWVELGPNAAGVTDVRIHQNRGGGTALCAVGTQYPDPTDWHPKGPGEVECQLCAKSDTPEGRAGARAQKRLPADPRITVSLDERIARRRADGKS